MIFVVDDEDAALVVAGSEFRFEQSAGVLQGHVALACQDAQRQIGAMLQLLHALLQRFCLVAMLISPIVAMALISASSVSLPASASLICFSFAPNCSRASVSCSSITVTDLSV